MSFVLLRKGGEFDASLDAVHGLLNVNTENTFRTPSEDKEVQRNRAGGSGKCGSSGGGKGECSSGKSDGGCGSGKCGSGTAAPFAINGNNTALWEVRTLCFCYRLCVKGVEIDLVLA